MSLFKKTQPGAQFGYIVLIAAAILFCAAAIFYLSSQRVQLDRQMQSLKAETDDLKRALAEVASKNPSSQNEWRTVATKYIFADSAARGFEHQCLGTIFSAMEGKDMRYCVGKNRLLALEENGKQVIVAQSDVANAEDAPLFMSLQSMPNASDTNILISYAADTCYTLGDCGAGMPTNYVTYAYSTKNQTARRLSQYPSFGIPDWAGGGTKALFEVVQTGGAGADVGPIMGYDLVRDKYVALTKEKGAAADLQNPTDVNGNPVAQWKNVRWEDGKTFSATLFFPDGTQRDIKGVF